MSVFNAEQTITADQLVGEDKKYKTFDDLANAYANADAFIERLKNENEGLRTDLSAGLSVKDVLDQYLKPATTPVTTPAIESPQAPTPALSAEPAPQIKPEDLIALVRKVNEEDTKARTAQQNADEVEKTVIEAYGTPEKANEAVKARAAELGVSVEFLQSVALQSPKAFYAQMGLDTPKQQQAPQPTRADVNTAAFAVGHTQIKPGTYAYYENLRKTDRNAYWSPKVQNQLHADRTRLGEKFYEGSTS